MSLQTPFNWYAQNRTKNAMTTRSVHTCPCTLPASHGLPADALHLSLRREFLASAGRGFAGVALGQMLSRDANADAVQHHAPKVRRVIQLFMTGGASPMDTYDYKPELERLHGQMLGPKEKPEGFVAPAGAIMKSPFEFAQHGESGRCWNGSKASRSSSAPARKWIECGNSSPKSPPPIPPC